VFKKISEHLCLEKETMTIQQHASFDSSAAELNATSKLVKAWESKNAKNAARAGGVSLMALSLAACGGSDDVAVDLTPFAQSDIDTAVAAANTAAAATAVTVAEAAATAQAEAVAAAEAAIDITSNDAAVIEVAVDAALTDADGIKYPTVDAAITAAQSQDVSAAVAAAEAAILGDYATAQELIESNDAAVTTAATNAAEATLVAGTGYASVAALKAALDDATGTPTALDHTVLATDGVITGFTSTADTVSASSATYSNAIVMVDANTGDADVFNFTATADDDLDGTIAGIETVNVTIDYNSDADNIFTTALGGVAAGTTVNFNHVAGSGVSAVAVTAAPSSSLNFSTLHKDVDVAGINNSDLVIDLASTSETADNLLTVTGATVDALTVTSGGDLDLDGSTNDGLLTVVSGGNTDITAAAATTVNVTSEDESLIAAIGAATELTLSSTGTAAASSSIVAAGALATLNVSGNGAANYVDVTAAGTVLTTINMSGDQDVEVTVSGADHDTLASALTVTDTTTAGTTTLNFDVISATNLNTRSIDVDQIQLSADTNAQTISYGTGQTFLVSVDQTTLNMAGVLSSASTNELNIVIDDDSAATTTAQDITVTALAATNTKTVNLSSSLDNIALATSVDVGTGDLVVSGAGTFANATTNTTVANSIDASANVGAVTYFTNGGVATIKTGDAGDTVWVQTASTAGVTIHTNGGDDSINAITAETYTIDGGEGDDTVSFAASATLTADTFDLTNVEVLDIDAVQLSGVAVNAATTFAVNSSDVTGDTYRVVSTEDGTVDNFSVTVNGSVVNLSGLTMEAAAINTVIDANAFTVANSTTITGTNDVDTITIDGGTASEANGGGGADDITGGAGNDTIRGDDGGDTNLDGAGGADTIVGGEGADTIIGGAGSDNIDLTEVTAAIDTIDMTGHDTVDTITGFAVGATNGDTVEISIVGITAGAINELDDTTNDAANGNASIFHTVSTAFDADNITAATANVLVIDGNIGSATALETALEDGGDFEMTFASTFAIGDSFMVLYDDGVNSYLASITGAGAVLDNETAAAAEFTAANELVFLGVSDATDFVEGNFSFIT